MFPCVAFRCKAEAAVAWGRGRLCGLIRGLSPCVMSTQSGLSAPSWRCSCFHRAWQPAACRCQECVRVTSFRHSLGGSARLSCLPCASAQSKLLPGHRPQNHCLLVTEPTVMTCRGQAPRAIHQLRPSEDKGLALWRLLILLAASGCQEFARMPSFYLRGSARRVCTEQDRKNTPVKSATKGTGLAGKSRVPSRVLWSSLELELLVQQR